MPHENKLVVEYKRQTGQSQTTETDEFVWNAHKYQHEIDTFGNLVVCKLSDTPTESQNTHIKTYARGTWLMVYLDLDEHDL